MKNKSNFEKIEDILITFWDIISAIFGGLLWIIKLRFLK